MKSQQPTPKTLPTFEVRVPFDCTKGIDVTVPFGSTEKDIGLARRLAGWLGLFLAQNPIHRHDVGVIKRALHSEEVRQAFPVSMNVIVETFPPAPQQAGVFGR